VKVSTLFFKTDADLYRSFPVMSRSEQIVFTNILEKLNKKLINHGVVFVGLYTVYLDKDIEAV